MQKICGHCIYQERHDRLKGVYYVAIIIWHPKYNMHIAIRVTGYIEVTKQYGRHKIWSGKTGNEAMTQSLVVLK